MAFNDWLALREIKDLEFVSIQKGAGSEQLKLDQGHNFVHGQADVDASMEFCDTAAILKNGDLLLNADSGIAHLAGALGVPAWVALRWVPEWRLAWRSRVNERKTKKLKFIDYHIPGY